MPVGSSNIRLMVAACLIWTASSTQAAESPFARRVAMLPSRVQSQQPHPAVVRIVAAERAASAQGSGTLVDIRGSFGLVVTNWHVVRDATGPVTVFFPNGFRTQASVLKTDSDWDLAALLIWKPPVQPVAIATVPPHPGDALMIAGYGQRDYRSVTGRCTQYVAPGADLPYEMVEVSAEARQGDSGGPIFNERGELAGVLFGAARGTTAGSYSGRVRWFLNSVVHDMEQATSSATPLAASNAPSAISPTRTSVDAGSTSVPHVATRRVAQSSAASPPAAPVLSGSPDQGRQLELDARPHHFTPRLEGSPHSSPTLTFTDVIGDTPLEKAKALLAAVGLLAIAGRVLFGT